MSPSSLEQVRGGTIALAAEISATLVSPMIPPGDVIRVLHEAGVRFVLSGAYALNVWTDTPRATVDVDALVTADDHPAAVAAVRAAYPGLEVEQHEVVTRFLAPEIGRVVIDLMRPSDAFLQAVFEHTSAAEIGGREVLIPALEMAAAMKFAAMVSPWRELSKKYIDAGDFIAIVTIHPELDLDRLAGLAELLYQGAGHEVRRLADDARAGRRLSF